MKIFNGILITVLILSIYTWAYLKYLHEPLYLKYLIKEEVYPVFSIGSDIPENIEDLKYGYPFDYSQNVPFFYALLAYLAIPITASFLFLMPLYIYFAIVLILYYLLIKKNNVKSFLIQFSIMLFTEFFLYQIFMDNLME